MKSLIISIIILTGLQANAQRHTISLQESKRAATAYSYALKNGQLRVNSAKADVAAAKSDYLPSISGTGIGLFGFKDFAPAIPDLLTKGINNFYLLGVTGTQTLYAGGKTKTGNELAALQLQVSEILLSSVLKMQKDMLASGLIARNDLLKVKVQLSQLLVNKSKLQNGHRVALLDFSMYTGIPFDSLMVMQDTLNKNSIPALPALQPDTALDRNTNLPSLAVGLSAAQAGSSRSGIGGNFSPASFVTLSIPISNGLWDHGKQKVNQRKINEEIARNDYRDGQNQLRVGIIRYWYNIQDQLTQTHYAKDNLEQATENLKVNQDNYKAGLATIPEVLDAQTAYQRASGTVATAFADFYVRVAIYNYVTAKTDK